MAGDTPTPLRNNQEGTRFENGERFDLHKADRSLLRYDVVEETRNVEQALETSNPSDAEGLESVSAEINLRPRTVEELSLLMYTMNEQRQSAMRLEDTSFLKDEAA